MLDVRVYRAAFAPALIALFVAAFSLADRPAAVTTPFAPAGFDGGRAYTLLGELGEAFPNRAPGSPGDRALADRVADTFKQRRLPGHPADNHRADRASASGRSRRSSGCAPGSRATASS